MEVTVDDFPYNQNVRIFVDAGLVYLQCHDEYLDFGRAQVNPDELLSALNRILGWVKLNETAKTNVSKDLKVAGLGKDDSDGRLSFNGNENGSFTVFVIPGQVCRTNQAGLRTLITGIENGLGKARTEDAKNNADLFQ